MSGLLTLTLYFSHSQLIGLTIGPAFLSAAIYLCLGRIAIVYGAHTSRIKPRLYSKTFMAGDIVSLILQAAGGGRDPRRC